MDEPNRTLKCIPISTARRVDAAADYEIKVEALRIAAQLPRNKTEARAILAKVNELLEGYL